MAVSTMCTLLEDTRVTLVNKSRTVDLYKDASHGKNRFERKRLSKISSSTKEYNKIDMNELFKQDRLVVSIPVIGETDNYEVTISMDGVVTELAKGIKSNGNKLEYKTVVQALTKVFNTQNIKVKCSCPDFKFHYAHNLIVNNNSVDDTSKDPGPGSTGITAEMKGQGCKHILLVLANGDWLLKVASVINNYIHYASEHIKKPFLKVIFPKLYGVAAEDAESEGLVEDEEDLVASVDLIKLINDWARDRGKFKKGSNKNPATAQDDIIKQQADPNKKQLDQVAKETKDAIKKDAKTASEEETEQN